MLVSDHLFFFLKIGDDLRKTLFKDLNLVFIGLDLIPLHSCSLLILFLGAGIDRNISLDFAIGLLLPLDFLLVLFELVPLADGLEGQALVFIVNLTLNRLDCYN